MPTHRQNFSFPVSVKLLVKLPEGMDVWMCNMGLGGRGKEGDSIQKTITEIQWEKQTVLKSLTSSHMLSYESRVTWNRET